MKSKGVEVFRVEGKDGRLDLAAVLKDLAGRGITRLMVEGGPTVAAAFVQADLVDEAALFRSPNPLGRGHRCAGGPAADGADQVAEAEIGRHARRSAAILSNCSSGR